MSEGIVDLLETIEIDQQDGKRATFSFAKKLL
ncbi:MAG: hypothetical protein JWL62_1032, partial [Hyphomicrobiales bacterium]|nr:hypothetical protein [Hyphomicrobiales bacterium]